MSYRILVVEDEPNLGKTLTEYLESMDYSVKLATTYREADLIFQNFSPQLVLLDINLPDGNGLELAKIWRLQSRDFVFLFLSALNDPDTKVEGLELGAEDYITKPFALKELTLRLQRIFKELETSETFEKVITHGPLRILFQEFELHDALGNKLPLSQKECAILQLLYTNSPEVISRDKMIDQIWGEDKYPSNRTIDNYIVKLRKWSETDPSGTIQIQSVRGIGYKLIINKPN